MKKYSYEIIRDDAARNPRKEDGHLGTMVCWHSRYSLGDGQPKEDFIDYREALAKALDFDLERRLGTVYKWWDRKIRRSRYESLMVKYRDEVMHQMCELVLMQYIYELPLYLYDNSGIAMRTKPFSCAWDSGKVGFIYVTKALAKAEWGDVPDLEEKATACLEFEVKEYDQYLTGDVWGFKIYDADTESIDGCPREWVDSCWGFYGEDYCEEEAKQQVKWYMEREAKEDLFASQGIVF